MWWLQMFERKKNYDDYYTLQRKKKKHRKFSIILSFWFFLFLFGLIGVNILILYSTTDFWLAVLIDLLRAFALVINLWFVVMISIISVPFIIALRNFIIVKRKMTTSHYSVPQTENEVVQFLTNNKGESFNFASLIEKVNFQGTSEEFNIILKHLREENKIKRDKEDYPQYYVIWFTNLSIHVLYKIERTNRKILSIVYRLFEKSHS